jgi:hypothetical protein
LRCSGLHWKILVSNFPYNLICHILFNTCVDASRIFWALRTIILDFD